MNLRNNIIASVNFEALLTNFMNQNQISAYEMRNFLNSFIVKLDDIIQTDLLLELQEAENKQKEEEHQEE